MSDRSRSRDREGSTLRLFISGDVSGAGKSTVCLGLLGSLLLKGYKADDICFYSGLRLELFSFCRIDSNFYNSGYIKPATQGIQDTLTARFCLAKGIACRHIGPLIFYRGFTQAFLNGETKNTSELLSDIKTAVAEISTNKKIVLIDGVGYPSVGSIVGCSNAHVAKELDAQVSEQIFIFKV